MAGAARQAPQSPVNLEGTPSVSYPFRVSEPLLCRVLETGHEGIRHLNLAALDHRSYDRRMRGTRHGPGLAKTRKAPLVRARQLCLWQSSDYRWRELFESADVMSEGATRDEPDGAVYYGTTSVLIATASKGGALPDDQLVRAVQLLRNDPHARVRAVRIACLEAQLRASGPLGRISAELCVRSDRRGVRVDVDVEATVMSERAAQPTAMRRGVRR